MNRYILPTALSLLWCWTPIAAAEDATRDTYAGLLYTKANMTADASSTLNGMPEDSVNGSVEPSMITGRLGMHLNDIFGIEGRVGFGLNEGKMTKANYKIRHMYGLYGTARYSVAPQIDVYGLLGYARTETSYDVLLTSGIRSESSASAALGFQYQLTPRLSVNLEYMYLFDESYRVTQTLDVIGIMDTVVTDSDNDLTGFSLGASIHF